MHVIRALTERALFPACVATLGTFDGVHRGHQAILAATVAAARTRSLPAVVISFVNHPRSVLPGREAPPTLTTFAHRLKLLEPLGIDAVLALEFTLEFSRLERRQFVEKVLGRALQARHVVLGYNCKFGRDGRGDVLYLKEHAAEFGFTVDTVPPVLLDGLAISSTEIRAFIEDGDLRHAAAMLGRPVSVLGTVVHGDGRGGKIGIPTANLDMHGVLLPPRGVYAGEVMIDGGAPRAAVTNIGIRPTVDGTHGTIVETHLLDFSGDLYGREIEARFLRRLREERKFDSVDALVKQIHRDIADARRSEPAP